MAINPRTIDLLVDYFKDKLNKQQVHRILAECNIELSYKDTSQTPSQVLQDVLIDLLNKPTEAEKLKKILCKLVHPLTFGGNEEYSKKAINQLNSWLKYDDLELYLFEDLDVVITKVGAQQDEYINPEEFEEEPNRLYWKGISLSEDGRAEVKGVKHVFGVNKPPYRLFKALLEKRINEPSSDGYISKKELIQIAEVKNWSELKQRIRDIRKYFSINEREDKHSNIFQPSSHGYRLVEPH